jgi:transposase
VQRLDNNEGLLLLAYRSAFGILKGYPHSPPHGGDPRRVYTLQHQFSCGIDLHVDWMYLGILDATGEVRLHQTIPPNPQAVLLAVTPFREDVVVGVECLFTWSWLADLCEDAGMPCGLGHALSRRAMHGGQAQNDRIEAHTIAALRRGGRLPQAYVYPRRRRATRDLLRRSNHRRHQRAALDAPSPNTASPSNLGEPLGRSATPQNRRGLSARFDHRGGPKHMAVDRARVDGDAPRLADLEPDLETTAHGHDPVSRALLRPIPGVGKILALGRLDEREDSARCPQVQACVSSCRLVKRARESNGKRHGTRGTKLGNAHLTWAFSEAAGLLLQHNEPAKTYLTQIATRHGTGTALSILAHKLGRAVSGRRTNQEACTQEKCLATSGGRERISLASHWSHRGTRHTTCASRRAIMLVGQEPAPAVPVPNFTPGLLLR